MKKKKQLAQYEMIGKVYDNLYRPYNISIVIIFICLVGLATISFIQGPR